MSEDKDQLIISHEDPAKADELMFDMAETLRGMGLTNEFGMYRKVIPGTKPVAYGVYLSKYVMSLCLKWFP